MEFWTQSSEARFSEYVEALTTVLGRADRAGPLKDYCIGLLMPGERKSVEPMAAIVAPARVSAKHQSLLHLVSQAAWSDDAVLAKVRELVLPTIEAQGKIEAWIVDDTGFAKKGVHSVGVARQYCGRLGKTDNCQIAVTLDSGAKRNGVKRSGFERLFQARQSRLGMMGWTAPRTASACQRWSLSKPHLKGSRRWASLFRN